MWMSPEKDAIISIASFFLEEQKHMKRDLYQDLPSWKEESIRNNNTAILRNTDTGYD